MKEKKEEKYNLGKKPEDLNLDLDEVLEKKRKRKRLIIAILIIIASIATLGIMTYRHYRGNNKHLTAEIEVTSSSILYSETQPEDIEDVGEGALFIIKLSGIKREDFLAEYEVQEISINEEIIDLSKVTYRHLNNALSIRMHTEKYLLEKGNSVILKVKQKSSGQIFTERLYNTTEVK